VHMADPYLRVDRPLRAQLRLDRPLRSAHSPTLPCPPPPITPAIAKYRRPGFIVSLTIMLGSYVAAALASFRNAGAGDQLLPRKSDEDARPLCSRLGDASLVA
jgi:hypothetical protein